MNLNVLEFGDKGLIGCQCAKNAFNQSITLHPPNTHKKNPGLNTLPLVYYIAALYVYLYTVLHAPIQVGLKDYHTILPPPPHPASYKPLLPHPNLLGNICIKGKSPVYS